MSEADKSEFVRLYIDKVGKACGIIIPCTFFRESGKYYMEEEIIIPLDTKDFEIVDAIKEKARMNYFIITGKNLRGVPFLIPNWNKD